MILDNLFGFFLLEVIEMILVQAETNLGAENYSITEMKAPTDVRSKDR